MISVDCPGQLSGQRSLTGCPGQLRTAADRACETAGQVLSDLSRTGCPELTPRTPATPVRRSRSLGSGQVAVPDSSQPLEINK